VAEERCASVKERDGFDGKLSSKVHRSAVIKGEGTNGKCLSFKFDGGVFFWCFVVKRDRELNCASCWIEKEVWSGNMWREWNRARSRVVIYQDISIDDQSSIREFWWMMAMVVAW
jgi:hypothetical protein